MTRPRGQGVLVLAYESPLPPHGGYRLRILHLARQLAARGPVEVAALGPVVDAGDEPFALVGVAHSFSRRRALVGSLRRPYLEALLASPALEALAGTTSCAIVQISSPFFLDAARAAGVPIVLDAHNVEAEIMATLASTEPRWLHRRRWRWEAAKLARVEQAAALEVDAVVTTSQADADVFRSWGARRVVVVPNGVDTTAVPYQPTPPGSSILFVGQFGYRPNEQAALELVDQVLPKVRAEVPEARVRLVGRNPSEAMRRRDGGAVAVIGPVPEVVSHLHDARVVAVPLRAGSGTRLKILEAMAAGTPVVSTPLGAAGIDARHGEEILIGESPAELAELIVNVLRDDGLAASLSARARALVESRYDWSVLAPPLLALHAELVSTATGRDA